MDISHHRFSLEELSLCRDDIEMLMGYAPGESPDPFPGIIEDAFARLGEHCEPEGGFTILQDPVINLPANSIRIRQHTFSTDKIVTRMLRRSEEIALFACTAGPGIEKWMRDCNESGDPVSGFVIDAFGSKIADRAAERIQEMVREKMLAEGKAITNRYSPGYCDWPVRDQQKLFSFFPDGFCGITLSETSMMHPIKSVSGVIGIGKEVRFNPYPCDACRDERCTYRRLKPSARTAG